MVNNLFLMVNFSYDDNVAVDNRNNDTGLSCIYWVVDNSSLLITMIGEVNIAWLWLEWLIMSKGG